MADSKKNIYILSKNQGNSKDGLRDACGNYWTATGEFPQYGDLDSYVPQVAQASKPVPGSQAQTLIPTKSHRKVEALTFVPRSKKINEINQYPFYSIEEEFDIYSKKDKYGSTNQWINFVSEKVQIGKVFYDYSMKIFTPLSPNEAKVQNSVNFTNYYKTDFAYNYYARMYELTTGNQGTPEKFLPNIYFFVRNREKTNDALFEALTAGGQLAPSELRSLRKKESKLNEGAFFDSFGKAQINTPNITKDIISQRASNIFFDTNVSDINKQAIEDKTIFPLCVDINFMSDSMNEFTEILEDSKMFSSLMSYLSLIPADPTQEERDFFDLEDMNLKRYHEVITASDPEPSRVFIDFENLLTQEIDLNNWFVTASNNKRMNSKKSTFIDNPDYRKLSKFEKTMYSIIFYGKLRSLAKKSQRSYSDISDGVYSYSETFCYRIDKSYENGEPFQTIWLPNTNEIDMLRYIDTQVKYGKKYRYKVTAYQFILGSQYVYTAIEWPESYGVDNVGNVKQSTIGSNSTIKTRFKTAYARELFDTDKRNIDEEKFYHARIKVETSPCIKIVAVPLFESEGLVIDKPPVPPHVDIIPYKGIKDKLLFNLNTSVGRYQMNPVILSPLDSAQATLQREAQGLSPNEKITYRTDDPLSAFQVYRLSTPPQNMSDFFNGIRAVVNTDINSRTIQKSSAASFVDNLEPNTNYYYMFRAVDIHNNVSNPTDIYKVQLVENDGAVFPLIEVYEIKKNKPQKPSKTAKKLFNIVPRLSQTIINNSKSKLGDGKSAFNAKNVVLGQNPSPLFGERFKIRLISKKTGKKMDLNVSFKVEIDKK